jgi:2-deoxy-D-gluconate 3-dehydrogenase
MTTTKLFDLSGNVAVITGGNGGIGRSIAIGLAEAGASVAIFGRNEEKNNKTLAELKKTGIPAMAVQVDITKRL